MVLVLVLVLVLVEEQSVTPRGQRHAPFRQIPEQH